MRVFLDTIRTIFSHIIWIVITPFFGVCFLLLALLPKNIRRDNRLYYYLTSLYSRIIIWSCFIKLHITGTEHLPCYPDSPAIFVINHASSFDIALTEMIVGSYPHIWLSKAEYGKIPLLGFLMRRMHILVNRNDDQSRKKAAVQTLRLLKNKSRHLLMFPEGTRHRDGNIHDFHAGFALFAQKLNRPIIPIVIKGINQIFHKKSLIVDSSASPVTIVIGKPIALRRDTPIDECVRQVQDYFKQNITKH